MNIIKSYVLVSLIILVASSTQAQVVTGNLSWLVNQEIRLEGFNGLQTYIISSLKTDAKGNFSLPYSKSDYGVGNISGQS